MIHTLHLFSELDQKLIEILKSLAPKDWERKTLAPKWNIKDVASHLLDGTLRGISMSRDQFFGEKAPVINSYQDLVDFLNGLNADWVTATKRISPDLLIHLLESSLPLYEKHLQELDMEAKSIFAVDWAGEQASKVWFHIAREYTEKYHHQQQIRLAVGKEAELLEEKWYLPYLETSMRALPNHYKNTEAKVGTCLKFEVNKIRQAWFLQRTAENWVLLPKSDTWDTEVRMDRKIAWQIFSKGISRSEAAANIQFQGDEALATKILEMVAVMA